jgi:hypothetical protein
MVHARVTPLKPTGRIVTSLLVLLAFCNNTIAREGDEFLIVDCALPGQIRQLGQKITYLSPRRPVKTTAADCQRRGGEYVVVDRVDPQSAIRPWLDEANDGDTAAMTYIGEILERRAQSPGDLAAAVDWYHRAATNGNRRAQVNLGYLYEQGIGVNADPDEAARWYRLAVGANAGATRPPAPGEPGPRIRIIQPALALKTRGLVKVTAPSSRPTQEIVGQVSSDSGLLTLHVNGVPTRTDESGLFVAAVYPGDGAGPIEIVAIDRNGLRSVMELLVNDDRRQAPTPGAPKSSKPDLPKRQYHALLIGNDDYRSLHDLRTPIADVSALNRLLGERYGFRTRVLTNATRYEILSALNNLRATLTSNDNLLIYYAGHGELDTANSRGHWLPVDAEADSTANWLSNVAITDLVNAIQARQVLVIADSCYSGTLTRSSITQLQGGMTETERNTWLHVIADKRARLVLTSGGVVPVLDAGGGRHSVFAKALLDTLAANVDILPGQSLYQAVTARVAHMASGYEFEQVPEFAPLSRAGHEAGDFLLIPVAER